MKTFFCLALLTFSSVPAFARTLGTADNVSYIVTVKADASLKSCAQQIRSISEEQGDGSISVLSRLGVVAANLTTLGAEQVAKLDCVDDVQENHDVHTNGRR